jgi:vitamin B12/bleomycin/antimicrobial peptide transport system ATP-binding/permease protein
VADSQREHPADLHYGRLRLFSIIAPILVAVPGYFSGDLSFGTLMMVVGAFMQVQGALRWFIDNFGTIADWRATLQRIATFRETLSTMDALGASAPRIKFVAEKRSNVAFENLQVATPTGCTMLSEQHVEIAPGDRVLIVGEPGAGKTLLFQAIAGLWPWGSGKVALPASNGVTFVPPQPIVPLGTLRAALAYPSPENTYKDEELVAVLRQAGLERLSSSLNRDARWDKELADEEQQRLALARILLHKPRWVVIDEALDALDDDVRNRVMTLFTTGLRQAAIVNIGRPETKHHYFERIRQSNPPSGRAVFLMYCRHDGNRRGWRSEAAKPPRDQTTCEGIRNQWTAAERILSQA